ncbi:MAG TPA: UXX-star (seleno)protein family 1 [Bacillota bacterium]|jgi:glutaredoxin 3|nr:UXX-star (seleno)protein family 1 [Peptococcaceae bacterium MAG4]NLW38139.1 glutaredoxin family protein [Peptococcaceae bacterium]HPZ43029.1 UXX-star (seleno)protein family 1 [Bacillota bacterium]HQD75558.1 UXX-star (seleno)protein family 1 [Bacillota bacterium]HUM57827.1 UXX-star (seleno)protein family 1 [Bacillota bacterium]
MSERVQVFGKEGCPYTERAREDLDSRKVPYDYYDVKKDQAAMDKMLKLTGGKRRVPVIVEKGEIKIGFGGT